MSITCGGNSKWPMSSFQMPAWMSLGCPSTVAMSQRNFFRKTRYLGNKFDRTAYSRRTRLNRVSARYSIGSEIHLRRQRYEANCTSWGASAKKQKLQPNLMYFSIFLRLAGSVDGSKCSPSGVRGTIQRSFSPRCMPVAALNRPDICQLYEVGADYLVMELVEGTDSRPADTNWLRFRVK
jgi:hypothetical protein